MSDAASEAVQAVALFGFLAVLAYGVTSCTRASFERSDNQIQLECIKQRGDWSVIHGCKFPAERKPS